jgi:autotransporter-associated beta strand protein
MTSALLYPGQVNTFDVANLDIGNSGSRSQGSLQFAAGLVNPVLTIAGSSGGSSQATLTLGRHDSYEINDAPVDVMDTTAGTLNAQFGSMIIGQSSPTPDSDGRGITITSSLLMGAGTLTASSLTLGIINSTADTTNYTISITSLFSLSNGGTATITNLTLAANNLSGSANVLTLAGMVSLTNGATLNTAAIETGAAASAAVVTAEVVLGGGTIGNVAGGGLTVSNVNVILAGAATNFVNVSPGRTGAVSSVISGPGTLAASGAGTVWLTGTNTYTGNTLVNAGVLRLGATGSIASSSGVVLASNAVFDVSQTGGFVLVAGQTLSGNGGVNGNVTATGGAQLVPGGAATAGTLTFSNALTLNGQSLTFNLSTNLTGGNDLVNVGGVLTLNSNSTVYLAALNGTLALGTYTLMNYASLAGGKTFVSGASRGVSLVVGTTNLTLVVTSTNGGANLTWAGDGKTNNWDVQTSTNWLNAGSPDVFYQGDNVNFTSTGSNTPPINLVTALLPTALTVNVAENYTFSGAGQLAGPVVLNKAGTGTLFLQTSNTYGGGTVISGGTVELDAKNAAGTGAISVGTNTLTVNIGAGTLTNAITGTGVINVTETSGDQTTLNSVLSAFAGTLNLPASPGGVAKTAFTSSGVNISSNATVTVASGGTFYLSGVTVAAAVVASGPGNSEGYGAVRVDNSTVAGPVMLQTNTWLGAYTGTTGVISGAISDGGNGYGVIVAGPGVLVFSGTNTYTGMTMVTNGTVTVTGNEAAANGGWYIANGNNVATETVDFNSGSTVAVTNGATFQLGYTSAIGATATLNVAGTVTNGGSLNVQRKAVFNLNSGGIWTQSGPMKVGPPGGSGLSTTMSVNSGSTFIYNNSANFPIVVSPAAAGGGGCTLNLGGTLVTSQGFTNAVNNSTASATIVFAGGTLQLAANIAELTLGVNTNNGATFSLGAGGGTINTAGFATAITNVIGGAGGLTMLGGGTLTLGATNTYTGGTTAGGGLLLVNGTAGTGAVTVQTNATLGGSGSLAGAATVQAGGTLQGGDINYSNTLTFGGGLTLGNSASAVTCSSFKIAAGGHIFGGALSVNGTNLINIQDATLPAGTNTLITYSGGSIGGANGFAGFQLGMVPAGVTAQLLNTGSAVELAVTPAPMVNTNSPVLVNSLSGGTLTLSWPSNHLGWRLEVQTNAPGAGLGTNWFTWPNSTNVTSTNFTVTPANPTTFFRLVFP